MITRPKGDKSDNIFRKWCVGTAAAVTAAEVVTKVVTENPQTQTTA
jgi:hypothetical protein